MVRRGCRLPITDIQYINCRSDIDADMEESDEEEEEEIVAYSMVGAGVVPWGTQGVALHRDAGWSVEGDEIEEEEHFLAWW